VVIGYEFKDHVFDDAALWPLVWICVIDILHHIVTVETLKVTTYNMYGFQSGLSCLTDPCDSGVCDIIGVQEHWLAPYNLNELQNFHTEFDCLCWSAMAEKLQSGLLTGRPFGGIGVLISKHLT